jgi:hypothetical protein
MKPGMKQWTKPALISLGAFIAGALIATPFFVHKDFASKGLWMVNTHDMIQHLAVMKDFDKVLKSGTLYPRWLSDINNGYGIPWMNFYPPGFYYAASIVNAAFNDWTKTLFAISIFGFAASGLAFYWLVREFRSTTASAIAALFYMLVPYHVINLYWQGAMPQFLGFIFLPLTLLFAYRVGSAGRLRDYAGLGLFYGAYLMTHAPVSFLMSYTLAFYGIVWTVWRRDWKIALRIAMGMIVGLALGAIYWLPAAIETKDIQEHFTALFPYNKSYITLMPLEGFGNLLNHSFALQTLTIILAAFIIRNFLRTNDESSDWKMQTRMWILMAAVTTFMSTSFSIYVSELLPKIQIATFAWRWLAISNLFTALLVAAAIDRLRAHTNLTAMKRWACAGGLAALMVWNVGYTIQGVVRGALSNPPFNAPEMYVEGGFTPVNSTLPQNLPETPQVVIQPEGGASETIRWDPYHRDLAVSVDQPSQVRLRTYNFPGWSATVDGQKTPIESDRDGIQIVSVPAGRHRIESSFTNTAPRTVGALLSALGLLAVLSLGTFDRAREANRLAEEATTSRVTLYVKLLKPVAPVAFALLIGAVLLFWLSSGGRSAPAAGNNLSVKTRTSAASTDEKMLHIDGATSVVAAADERALDDLMNALASRNNSGVDSLVESGRAFRLPNDTTVRMLQFGGGKTKVRILQGEHLMTEVWVPERWIK